MLHPSRLTPPSRLALPGLGQRTSCIPRPSPWPARAPVLSSSQQRTDGAAHLSAQVTQGRPPLAFPEFSCARPGTVRSRGRDGGRGDADTCLGPSRGPAAQTDNKRPPSSVAENTRMPARFSFPLLFSNSQDFSGAFRLLLRAVSAAGPYPRLSPPPVECKDLALITASSSQV